MPPKKRLKESAGLPKGWRWKHGAYYYRVPAAVRHLWDDKTEYRLGNTLARAHRTFSEKIATSDDVRTMEQAFDRYLVECTPHKALSTQENEIANIRRLKSILGGSSVAAVRPTHIYQVYEALKKRGLTTANRHMETLSAVFTACIRWGARDDHPMTGNKFRKERPAPPKIYYTDDQVLAALELATPMLRAYVWLKLSTGLRRTDILRLTVPDWQEDGLHVTPSKTAKTSRRSLVFDRDWHGPGLAADRSLEDIMRDVLAYPKQDIRKYLFVTRTGTSYIKPDNSASGFESAWDRWMEKVQAAHGFKLVERYLRNKVASDAESTRDAADMLAHSSTSTTEKHYRAKPTRIGVKR